MMFVFNGWQGTATGYQYHDAWGDVITFTDRGGNAFAPLSYGTAGCLAIVTASAASVTITTATAVTGTVIIEGSVV